VGASDLDRTSAFLRLFGFEVRGSDALPAEAARALYGLEGPADEQLLSVPGAELGRVRLVATPHPARSYAPFDARPFAIDLYSTDIEASVAFATENGLQTSPITDHTFGPVVIREVEITGPDDLIVTLLEPNMGRRSSILDSDPGRLHSEVHAFVWSDTGLDDILPYWGERGYQTLIDAVLDTPGLGALVGAPDEDVRMRLAVFADDEARPIRVEFVEFIGRPSTPQPSLPLAAGLHAPAFEFDDLQSARAAVGPAEIGDTVSVDTAVHPGMRAATVATPAGHRIEIWAKS
jgi:catechol 2,3-dioxygenase-like lactoylglutathione lyase family enzyme